MKAAFTSLAATMVVKKPEFTDAELIPSCLTPVKFDESKLANSGNGM